MAKLTDFGKKVKIAMIQQDIETKDIVKHCDFTQQYFADILRGARPGKKYRPIICKFLGISE